MDIYSDKIAALLDKHGLAHAMPAIQLIIRNFDTFPFGYDAHEPAAQILSVLQDISDSAPIPANEMRVRMIFAIQGLECFSYRALCDKADKRVFWNPLEEPFRRFNLRANGEAATYQTDTEYPPSDMIRSWFVGQLQNH